MSDCPEAALAGAALNPPSEARAARLEKFKRERLIVDYLNRGVSVAEIAAQIGVGDVNRRPKLTLDRRPKLTPLAAL